MAAQQDQGEGAGVFARIDREVARRSADQVAAALHVRGCILDADDAGHLRQAQHGVVLQVGDRPARNVVKDHRDVHRLGDLAEVPVQPLLRRFVVVRHDRKAGGGASFLRRLRQFNRLSGGIAAGSGDHRDAALGVLDGDPDQLLVLVEINGRRLARGAHHHDAVGALGDVPVDQALEAREVEPSILQHRGNDRDQAAGNHVCNSI